MPRVCDPIRLVFIAVGMALVVLRLFFQGACTFDVPFCVPSFGLFPIHISPRAEMVGAPSEDLRQVVPLQLLGR